MVSVLIPARNETYLAKTIEDILSAAESEIEIIAVCDGYWPEPPIKDHPNVILIHNVEAIGQRPAINQAARIAKGKYILKTDAHSMFDKGFDVKLIADCEYNWTVIPRMYNLDIDKWQPKRRKVTDFMWIRSPNAKKKPFRHYYWDGPCKREHPEEYRIHKEWAKTTDDIADVMTGQGACFFMHKDRFWELGGMDEKHGQWGQMGVEIALKAWLSGGSLKVNKKTWFAHWFRGGGGPGFPWPASSKRQDKARKYSLDFWMNNRWPLQKRPLSWLVNKFAPLPEWNNNGDVNVVEDLSEQPLRPSKHKPWTQAYCKDQLTKPIEDKIVPATIRTIRNNDSRSYMHGRTFPVKELYENRLAYCRDNKLHGIRWQMEIVPPFIKRVLNGEDFEDDEKIKRLTYYQYLVSRLNPVVNPNGKPTPRGVRHCIGLVRNYVSLIKDIRDVGLKSPIDMFITGDISNDMRDRVVITRGSRRIAVLYHLERKTIPARVWKSEWLATRFIPSAIWPADSNSIHSCAVRQFIKYQEKATDKYWRHNYTLWYDNHIGHWQKGGHTKRILELGVRCGMSLLLWHDAFPHSLIYGLDTNPELSEEILKGRKHIKVYKGNQKDVKLLKRIAEESGPFNVVIDDASHKPKNQRVSFNTLWPHLTKGGVYVIEDLQSNYRKKYKADSIVPEIKALIDNIYENHEVREVNWYPNIVFITKA